MKNTDNNVEFNFSEHFRTWLEDENISLLASTYQANKVIAIGSLERRFWIRQYPFKKCMGFYEKNGAVVISSANKISLFTKLLGNTQQKPFDLENDRVYYPRTEWITGDLKAHDMALCADDSIVFVNTAFDCLATVSSTFSFTPIWQPSYLKDKREPKARDCSHLNGLALKDGIPAYVTAIGQSTIAGGWREHKRNGGLLFDITTDDLLCESLSMPHSPRWHQGKLWLLNSGTGHFGYIDPKTGNFEAITFCPGFARGLTFHKHWAIITLSNMRRYKSFDGLILGEKLEKFGMNPVCGILAVNLNTGNTEHWLNIQGDIREFYDVSVLDCLRPSIVRSDEPLTEKIVLAPSFDLTRR